LVSTLDTIELECKVIYFTLAFILATGSINQPPLPASVFFCEAVSFNLKHSGEKEQVARLVYCVKLTLQIDSSECEPAEFRTLRYSQLWDWGPLDYSNFV
jgi:hypothetical protein